MKVWKYSKDLYSRVAFLKSAYSFIDKAYLHLDSDDDYFFVSVVMKENEQEITEEEFSNELLAQSVRHEIYLQTKNIRELLMARAFSTSMMTNEKLVLENNSNDEQFSEDEILKDWFEANGDKA